MISKELARRFIERVSKHTDYNINIMDENGIIIASRDPDRIGNYHEIAYRIVHGSEDIMDTTGMRYPGVLPGINMVIEMDRRREGVVSVTGDPDEIRPIAMIVKMALETMLIYERRQEKLRLRSYGIPTSPEDKVFLEMKKKINGIYRQYHQYIK